ncbi:MAG: hypothetical protein HY703_01985 [Gemmatimonadetes bacterium]|nr:hypothetical protein [Gemmatimonadota bacterium]
MTRSRQWLRRAGLAAAVAAAASCDSPTIPGRVEAYNFALAAEPPVIFHWNPGRRVRVFVAGGDDAARAAALAAASAAASREWNGAVLFGEYRLSPAERLLDADVVLRWSDVPLPVEVPAPACQPALIGRAVTTFCPTADTTELRVYPLKNAGPEAAGQVRMIVTVAASEAQAPERVLRLVAHEFGHVLGIWRHAPGPSDLMWGGVLVTERPTPADRATIQVLYHTPADVFAP